MVLKVGSLWLMRRRLSVNGACTWFHIACMSCRPYIAGIGRRHMVMNVENIVRVVGG